ncbi:hypothetical protein HanHA300_Chr17g0651011 [Helianthus annuus]|nr:hypothetical protein HanHA300_Chr17g0651011 [Helianthus annuus]
MEIDDHCALDWGALEEVAEAARARQFIGDDTPWSRLFDIAYTPSYRVMACQFLSSFDFAPRPADHPEEDDDEDDPWIEVTFRLAGQWHLMSLRQFAEHYDLYRVEELDTPIYTDGIWMPPPPPPPYDSDEVLAGDQHASLRHVVEPEGFLYHRSPLPLPAQAYCHIYSTTRVESRVVHSGGSLLLVLPYMGGGEVRPPSLPSPVVRDGVPQVGQVCAVRGGGGGGGGGTSHVSSSPWALFPSRTNYSWMGAWWSRAF